MLKDVPLRRVLLWTALLGTGLGLTQLLLITGARLRVEASVPRFFHGSFWGFQGSW